MPPGQKVRLAIVEDEPDFMELLLTAFSSDKRVEVVGAYSTGQKAANGILKTGADLVFMDLNLPDISGIQCLELLREQLPEIRVIILTGVADERVISRALCAGANGYIVKLAPFFELRDSLSKAIGGHCPLSQPAADFLVQAFGQRQPLPAPEELSPRECEVLNCFSRSMRDKEIAAKLRLKTGTIHSLSKRIFQKLGVHSRREAVRRFKLLFEGIGREF